MSKFKYLMLKFTKQGSQFSHLRNAMKDVKVGLMFFFIIESVTRDTPTCSIL